MRGEGQLLHSVKLAFSLFQTKSSRTVTIGSIQGKNSSWLMIYIYLVIYAHHVSLLGEVIKFKCMLDSFIKAHSWGFWTTEAPYNFCLFS